jgi:hypothetical protein
MYFKLFSLELGESINPAKLQPEIKDHLKIKFLSNINFIVLTLTELWQK